MMRNFRNLPHRPTGFAAAAAFALSLLAAAGCDDNVSSSAGPPPNSSPALIGLLDRTVEPDSTLAYPIAASRNNSAIPILRAFPLPAGSNFVDSGNGHGALEWTPTLADLGTYAVTFYAIDAADTMRADSQTVALTVGYDNTATSEWNGDSLFWRTTLDATDSAAWLYFSFAARDVVGPGSADWDLAFRRERVMQQDSVLFPATGQVLSGVLQSRTFASVTAADSVFAVWRVSEPGRANMSWFRYYHPSLTAAESGALRLDVYPRVFVMTDATGEHFVKARVDSSNGRLGGFPDMGNIYLSYYYQPVAGSRDLGGEIRQVVLAVGTGAAYFDFSSGSRVYPADPATSLDWDVLITRVALVQNGGISGPGQVRSHPVFLTLADPIDLGAVTGWDETRPLWDDFHANPYLGDYASTWRNWFVYDGPSNRFEPASRVFLLKSRGRLFKLAVESYDAPGGSNAFGGTYTLIWKEL